jgi:ComF family protein
MFKAFLQLLYPKLCFACQKPLFRSEDFICTSCRIELPRIDLAQHAPNWIRAKFDGLIEYEHAHAFFAFLPGSRVQQLMHQIKYKGAADLGVFLGEWAGESLKKSHFASACDCLIAIPLHPKRLKERGYNQAEVIAFGLGAALQIPVISGAMCRTTLSHSLTSLSRAARYEELENVFEVVNPVEIRGLNVLLIDDTLTTGATLLAAAQKIRAAGATKVSFFALAALK